MKPLPANFSVYLDGMRLAAATYVFLFHIMKLQIGPSYILKYIPDRGHDAVIVFFVLSGYVIAAATDRKRTEGLRGYFLDRAARVYSVAVPTLIFSVFIAILINTVILPDGELNIFNLFKDSVINLFFLGQSWSWQLWVPYNQPYWSLCYEVIYYAAFGIIFFWNGANRIIGLIIVAIIAGPKVLLLMPCWLIGVGIYYWRDTVKLSPLLAWFVAFIVPAVLAIALHKIHFGPFMRGSFETFFGDQKSYLAFSNDFYIDYVTAILISINIYASRYIEFKFSATVKKILVGGAAISFTLYLMHLPMIFLVKNIMVEKNNTLPLFFFTVVGIPLACFWISQFTELKRSELRMWLGARLPKFI